MPIRKLISVLLIPLPIAAVAQTLDEPNLLNEVTVAAYRTIGERAVVRTVIDSSAVEGARTNSLADLLSRHSPVFVKSYGAGSAATVSFRGTAASHTQVEWNGININNPMLGQVDFSLIPVWFVDDASLYHGGSSLQQGSGALGGSVSLRSLPRWDRKIYGSLAEEVASYGTYRTFAEVGGGGKKWQSRVRYLYEQAENDFTFYNNAVLPHREEKQVNADYRQQGAVADLFWNPNRKNLFSLSGWYLHADRNQPPIMSYEGLGREEWQKEDQLRLSGSWKNFGTKYKSDLTAGYARIVMNYFLANTTNLGKVVNYDSRSTVNSFYLKYHFEWNISSRTLFRVMAEGNYHDVGILDRRTFEGYSHDRFEAGLSASIHRRFLDKLSGYLLLREDLTGSEFSPLMPSVGLDYTPLNNADLVFKLNGTRNYHQPTLNDLYWMPGGNPDLKPEEGYTADLSAEYNWKRKRFSLSATATGYLSWINDWIIWRPGEFRYWTAENVKKVFARGTELKLSGTYRFNKLEAGLGGNYAYTRTTNQEPLQDGDESVGRQLIYIPEHKANAFFNASYGGFYLEYAWEYISERYTTSSNERTRHSLPAYDLHNIMAGKRMEFWNRFGVDIRIKVNNLFDKDYQAVLWRAMPGRNYSLLVKLSI